VASESPSLASYYAEREARPDLVCVSLSDPEALKQLSIGDFIIIARGRRYFSNDALTSALSAHATPIATLNLGPVPSAKIYELDQQSISIAPIVCNHGDTDRMTHSKAHTISSLVVFTVIYCDL
jgi:hypothetical protein